MSEQQDIRPASFDDFVGQRDVVDVLRRAVVAARHGDRPCGHVLLAGLPGCGKTSMAAVVAAEMGTRLHAFVATAIRHAGELTGLLTGLGRHDVLFLDEVHGLKPATQELLYTAMEDGHVDLSAGRRAVRIPLRPFTLVGATTRAHLLTGPLRDRFAYTFQLGHYSVPDLTTIARRTMDRLGITTTGGEYGREILSNAVALRSRGTPRVANRLVRCCRDFMESAGEPALTLEIAEATFDALGVDDLGLDAKDRAYLELLCERVGSPVGVLTICAQLGVERGVVEGLVEPWLLESGLVRRTPQGRVALPAAVAHLQRHAERARVNQLVTEPSMTTS